MKGAVPRPVPQRAALGFRAHTGWAAAVAVAGAHGMPKVVARRRLDLLDRVDEKTAQVYHAAADLPLDEAERLVRRTTEAAANKARAGLRDLVAELRRAEYDVVASGVVLGNGRLPQSLKAILRSHPLVHTAEGELYRRALVGASEACGLDVTGVSARDLYAQASKVLGEPEDRLRLRLTEAGRDVGSPWTQDQKESMLVAWLALRAAR